MRSWIVFIVVAALWLLWCVNPSYNAATSEFQMTGMITFGSLLGAIVVGLVVGGIVAEAFDEKVKQNKYRGQEDKKEIAKAMAQALAWVADIAGDRNYTPNLDSLKYKHSWDLLTWWNDEMCKIQRKAM